MTSPLNDSRTLARLLGLLSLLLAPLAFAQNPVAWAKTPQGRIALPEDLGPVNTEQLVDLEWSPHEGARARVAVSKVDNTSKVATYSMSNNQGYSQDVSFAFQSVPVNGIEAMITDIMNSTGRFRMVERQNIGNVLQEQNFGASGRVSSPSAAAMGKVLGAEFLVEAVVTTYEPNVAGGSVNVGALARNTKLGGLLGGLHVGSKSALIGMNFRLINAATSEVIFTQQVDRELKQTGLAFGGGGYGGNGALGGFIGQYSKTPIGQAVFAAINEGVYELIKEIGARPVDGSVVKVDGSRVFLNLGSGQVEMGETLSLWSKGEALIDPETGLSLGTMDREIGSVRVNQVAENFSIADLVGGKARDIKRGDVVKSSRPPPPLQFGPLDPVLTKKPKKARRHT